MVYMPGISIASGSAYTVKIGASLVTGSIEGLGSFTCISSYNQNFVALPPILAANDQLVNGVGPPFLDGKQKKKKKDTKNRPPMQPEITSSGNEKICYAVENSAEPNEYNGRARSRSPPEDDQESGEQYKVQPAAKKRTILRGRENAHHPSIQLRGMKSQAKRV